MLDIAGSPQSSLPSCFGFSPKDRSLSQVERPRSAWGSTGLPSAFCSS